MTHYYKFCYVREVIERKEAIVLQIQTFFDEHLCETIPATTYVIDFAFLPTEELIVVELNPFVCPHTCWFQSVSVDQKVVVALLGIEHQSWTI